MILRHPRLGEVECVRSPRSKRTTIHVRPSGSLRLTYPRWVSLKRAATFLDEKADWIEATRRRLAERFAGHEPKTYTPERIEELRRAAKADLPPRAEAIARRLGFRYGKIAIRAARTKWASCSASNNLSLSLFMMLLPEHLRDFVIVHELCHTVHHNHSAEFHALVDRCVGGKEKLLTKELRSYTIR